MKCVYGLCLICVAVLMDAASGAFDNCTTDSDCHTAFTHMSCKHSDWYKKCSTLRVCTCVHYRGCTDDTDCAGPHPICMAHRHWRCHGFGDYRRCGCALF